jgi:hypothetical protein
MKIKELNVKIIRWNDLSDAIKCELSFLDITTGTYTPPSPGTVFWAHAPKTIEDLENEPNWAEFCRQEGFGISDNILIEVPWPPEKTIYETKRIKKSNKKH